jgi:hypothetical protein
MRRDVHVVPSGRQAAPERHLNWHFEGIQLASYWVSGPVWLSVTFWWVSGSWRFQATWCPDLQGSKCPRGMPKSHGNVKL